MSVASPAPGRPIPSGTVAFLFSDIEGSTARWERYRDAMARAVDTHDRLVAEIVVAHGGYAFKTLGDAFCVAFATVPQAVAAALAVQRRLGAQDFGDVGTLRVRIAIHAGAADERGGDYFGPAVNRVARLLAIAHGGQVVLSGVAADLAQGNMPPETALRDRGAHRLKDLAYPEQVYQLIAADLPSEFPPLRSLDALPHNLPLQLTAFVGREREVAEIEALLETSRLVTLVGTGGVGKTRISLQIGADLLDAFPDGVWFVELAPIADPALIVPVVAALFSVRETPPHPLLESVVYALREKRALLVFDNCEHLVAEAARTIAAILRGAPQLRALASSREALAIPGETSFRVPSLETPDERTAATLDAASASAFNAIALFVERARAADSSFVLTDENAPVVAEIVRRLDGIALALELAAPRIKLMTPRQLADRLSERFRLLTGGDRTALPRQQTMRALIDWSYDLLTEREQKVFRRLACFAGGFTLEAAGDVCADGEIEAWDAIDALGSLVDKSLVVPEFTDNEKRLRLLESTRQYAVDKLAASGERDAAERAHARWFAAFAQRAGASYDRTPDLAWVIGIVAEIENLRAALGWAITHHNDPALGAAIAASLVEFWTMGPYLAEGFAWCTDATTALPSEVDPVVAARLAIALARTVSYFERGPKTLAVERAEILAAQLGDGERFGALLARIYASYNFSDRLDLVEPFITEALAIARRCKFAKFGAIVLGLRANMHIYEASRHEDVVKIVDEAIAALTRTNAGRASLVLNSNRAELLFALGKPAEAYAILVGMTRPSQLDPPVNACIRACDMARCAIALGKFDAAMDHLRVALKVATTILEGYATCSLADASGQLAAARRESITAARLFGFLESELVRRGIVWSETERTGMSRAQAFVAQALGPTELDRETAVGESYAVDDVFTIVGHLVTIAEPAPGAVA
jgi:predicted ATPase/class 3 adenylate cyclase